MKRWHFLFLSLLLVCLAAAGCQKKPPIDPGFIGTWASDATTARMSIAVEGDQVVIKAWDTKTGADFEVKPLEITFDQITAEFYFPPNDFRTTRTYTLNGADGLKDTYTGGAQGTIYWYKLPDQQ